jgi:hypothetical protein
VMDIYNHVGDHGFHDKIYQVDMRLCRGGMHSTPRRLRLEVGNTFTKKFSTTGNADHNKNPCEK